MCPLWPFHTLLLYIILLGPVWFACFGALGAAAAESTFTCDVTFEPEITEKLLIGETRRIDVRLNKTEIQTQAKQLGFGVVTDIEFIVDDPYLAYVNPARVPLSEAVPHPDGSGMDMLFFNITGNFLGYTQVCATSRINDTVSEAYQCMRTSVIRKAGVIDKAFTFSVAILVSIIYVNMGAAIDIRTLRETVRRPYGPLIGFFSQFVVMPVLAYFLAKVLIPTNDSGNAAALQLGLFITGCSPGGGASNIWTLTLGGNLDLSIAMTTISTFSAFAMMPLWILTLGSTIFADAKLAIPYSKIAMFAFALVVPLSIGVGIQLKWPKVAKFLVKILKPFAVFLILFIIVFAVYTNFYLFSLFTWPILLSGMFLPWLGYLIGGGIAYLSKQEWRDIIAIGIETGVQNTGLAIFALRFSLPQPEADLTTVLPVAVACMTPILPACLIIYQKVTGKYLGGSLISKDSPFVIAEETNSKEGPTGIQNLAHYGSVDLETTIPPQETTSTTTTSST